MMDMDIPLSKVDGGIKLEDMECEEIDSGNVSVKREFEGCNNCLEWKEKLKQAEERVGALKSEIEKKIQELESLKGNLSALQLEKLVVEDEVQSLRRRNKEVEEKVACTVDVKRVEKVVDLTEDASENKVMELMIENKALDCEKKKAESEVDVWKAKCKELESRVMGLEQRLASGGGAECNLTGMMELGLGSPGTGAKEVGEARELQGGVIDAVTPLVGTSCTNLMELEGGKRGISYKNDVGFGGRARKQLVFGEEGSPNKKIAPTTPAGARPTYLSIIDISDSEGEGDTTRISTIDIQASKKAYESTDCGGGQFPAKKNQTGALDQSDEDHVIGHNGIALSKSTSKRKRAFNIVTSDSESDTDDHFPISQLRIRIASPSRDKQGESVVRRRLVTLRKLKEEGTSKKSSYCNSKRIQTQRLHGIQINKSSSDDETEENESDSETSNLNGFIVGDSDSSASDGASKDDDTSTFDGSLPSDDFSGELSNESDGNIDYEHIIGRIGRRKVHKAKWEFEGDMLAAFGKDPELCMKAVCALYRQQTSDEKFHKATIVRNERGFSQCDAYRGTKLGEFLTDGDPQGVLKKTVEELEEYDPKGHEHCRTLATHYSKQLFEIFQNKEDPLWP